MIQTNVVGGVFMAKIGEILRKTKGDDSYPVIARRASVWLRKQCEDGRAVQDSVSPEQIRKIFEDMVARPAAIYLEALSAVQNVDLNELLEAAGYPPRKNEPTQPTLTPELLEELGLSLRGNLADLDENTINLVLKSVKETLEKDARKGSKE